MLLDAINQHVTAQLLQENERRLQSSSEILDKSENKLYNELAFTYNLSSNKPITSIRSFKMFFLKEELSEIL